ncbi:MAG: Uma2 family endonuclease [Anaerolineae bacterium]|jgi:Uma2 family endonuclease|nr:Uma2 family endonuclease [Anaerolineae bacterium]
MSLAHPPDKNAQMTLEDFERFLALPENDGRLFELIDGAPREKMPTEQHAEIQMRIAGEIYIYLKQHPGGRVTTEARHRASTDTLNDRLPDVAYTRPERVQPVVKRGAVPQLPDLCVEVKSPSDTYLGLRAKAAYYLSHGSTLVWLVFPDQQVVEVHTADAPITSVGIDGALSGMTVLPGFTLPLSLIFEG